jgi:hypothetical protein
VSFFFLLANAYAYRFLLISGGSGPFVEAQLSQISALCARLSSDPNTGHRKLALLFAELDAFKTRLLALSDLAQPQCPHALSFQKAPSNSSLDTSSSVPWDDVSGSTHFEKNFGYGQDGVDDLNPIFDQIAEQSPTNGVLLAIGNVPQALSTTNEAPFPNVSTTNVGMNENIFQSPNLDQPTQDWFYTNENPISQDFHAEVYSSMAIPAGTRADWNNYSDFDVDAPSSMQSFEVGMSTTNSSLQQQSSIQPETSSMSPPRIVTPATASAPSPVPSACRYTCPRCIKTFSRRSDRDRHALSHDPNAPRYTCPAHHCARVFPRKDKLADHRRRLGH